MTRGSDDAGDDALFTLAARVVGLAPRRRPVVVGIDGAVAVGKTTLAKVLAERLAGDGLVTAVVSADGFLLPAALLRARRLTERKGFPETFDRKAMAVFLGAVRGGAEPAAPGYSHATYDVTGDAAQPTANAAVVLFEGVNVLGADLAPLYDLTAYVDADSRDLEAWFLRRFVETPFGPARAQALAPWRPASGDPLDWGRKVWVAVNAPNLKQHIASGRRRAQVILYKAADHSVRLV